MNKCVYNWKRNWEIFIYVTFSFWALAFFGDSLVTFSLLSNRLFFLQLPEGSEGGRIVNCNHLSAFPWMSRASFLQWSQSLSEGEKWQRYFWIRFFHVVPAKPTHRRTLSTWIILLLNIQTAFVPAGIICDLFLVTASKEGSSSKGDTAIRLFCPAGLNCP